jgi:hypothetical protein
VETFFLLEEMYPAEKGHIQLNVVAWDMNLNKMPEYIKAIFFTEDIFLAHSDNLDTTYHQLSVGVFYLHFG